MFCKIKVIFVNDNFKCVTCGKKLFLFYFCFVYKVLSLSASNNGLGFKECLAYQMVGILYTHVYVCMF